MNSDLIVPSVWRPDRSLTLAGVVRLDHLARSRSSAIFWTEQPSKTPLDDERCANAWAPGRPSCGASGEVGTNVTRRVDGAARLVHGAVVADGAEVQQDARVGIHLRVAGLARLVRHARVGLQHLAVAGRDSVIVPSGDLQLMTFIAVGVDRSTGEPSGSWQMTSSWMNLAALHDRVDRRIRRRPEEARLGQHARASLRRRPGRRHEGGVAGRRPAREGQARDRAWPAACSPRPLCELRRSSTVPDLRPEHARSRTAASRCRGRSRSSPGPDRRSASAENSAVSLVFENICRTLNQPIMMLVRFAWTAGSASSRSICVLEAGGRRQAAVVGGRRQRGVGQRSPGTGTPSWVAIS